MEMREAGGANERWFQLLGLAPCIAVVPLSSVFGIAYKKSVLLSCSILDTSTWTDAYS